MPIDSTQTPIIAHALIAIFGAFVHALNAQRNGESKTFLDLISLVVMSSFSGAMFALMGLHFLPDQIYLTMALAGTGGYLGIEGMVYIVELFKDRFEKK